MLKICTLAILFCFVISKKELLKKVEEEVRKNGYSSIDFIYNDSLYYEGNRTTVNLLQHSRQFPHAIFTPKNENEISEVLSVIHKLDTEKILNIRIFSGGHDYKGYSSSYAFVIKTKLLKGINVFNNNLAVVQSGNTNIDMYMKLEKYNLVPITGYSPNVGSGIFLSAGFGPFTRSRGLAIDNINGIRIILVNGTIVDANKNINKDIFWGVIGGGSNNFGVVVSYNITVYKLPQGSTSEDKTGVLFVNSYIFSPKTLSLVIKMWQEALLNKNIPNFITPIISYKTEVVQLSEQLKTTLIIFGGYCNSTFKDCETQITNIEKGNDIPTLHKIFSPISFTDAWINYLSGCAQNTLIFDNNTNSYSCYDSLDDNNYFEVLGYSVDRYIEQRPIEKFSKLMRKITKLGGKSFLTISPTDGRVMEINKEDTPYPYRNHKLGIWDFAIVGKTLSQFEKQKKYVKDEFSQLIKIPHYKKYLGFFIA